jgi:hypothetical protein
MFLLNHVRKSGAAVLAISVIGYLAAAQTPLLGSSACSTVIQYVATGTFSATPVSGTDGLRLAGNPFSLTLYACETKTPSKSGSGYAVYTPVDYTGTVQSSLLGGGGHNIQGYASIILSVPASGRDTFQVYAPVKVLGSLAVNIHAVLSLAPGTLPSTSIATFSAVNMFPAGDTLTYSTSTGSTTLSIASGTFAATVRP